MSITPTREIAERRPPRLRVWLAAACVVGLAVIGGLKLLPMLASEPSPVMYATRLGQQRSEQFPDGTCMTLNTDTTVLVRFGKQRREVVLKRGEAMFDVVHDPNRPFVVVTGDGRIKDIGTRFDVNDEQGMTLVTVLQGQVEVVAADQHRQLSAGKQARYGNDVAGIAVQRVDPGAITAWTHGRLDFNGLPLAKAVAEANRYSAVKLQLGDPSLAGMPVGGSFRLGDNAAIATALAAVFPVRVVRRDAHEIVLMPR